MITQIISVSSINDSDVQGRIVKDRDCEVKAIKREIVVEGGGGGAGLV